MKKNINILGSDISLDIFGMFENNGGFELDKCVNDSGIFSLCSPKLSETPVCTESDFTNSDKYCQQCAVLDINKTVFEYIKESDADYTIIDIADLTSKQIMQVRMKNDPDKDSFTYITKTQAVNENPRFLENAPFEVLKTFDVYEDEFTMMAFIYQYAEMLKEQFDQDKIIILEIKPMERYIDSDGKIDMFSTSENIAKKTRYLSEAYDVLENALPKAHVIKFPNVEILCNANHKRNLEPFSYIHEFYSYALDCVRAIACSADRKSEKVMLKSIKKLYEQLIRERYADTVNGEYPLQNKSFISSNAVHLGQPVTICLNARGGTGKYQYEVLIRKKYENNWQSLPFDGSSSFEYKPRYYALYELCIKASDENHVVKKEYFEFIVR